MGGGDLNLKKSWHPHTMKNQEKVWKAEQAKNAEDRKMNDLRREIMEEKNREDLVKIGQSSGVLAKNDDKKLEWMYKSSSELLNREDYLLGRPIDKAFEIMEAEEKTKDMSGMKVPINHVEHECIPFSIRSYRNAATSSEQVDLQRKILEDPLMMIKQKEMESRRKILENPVKLKELHRILKIEKTKNSKITEGSHNSKKSKKNKKSKKKKRRSSESDESDGSDKDLDEMLEKQYKKLKDKDSKQLGGLDLSKLLDAKYETISKELDKAAQSKKKKGKSKKNSKNRSRSSSSRSGGESDSEGSNPRNGRSKQRRSYRDQSRSPVDRRDQRDQRRDRERRSSVDRRDGRNNRDRHSPAERRNWNAGNRNKNYYSNQRNDNRRQRRSHSRSPQRRDHSYRRSRSPAQTKNYSSEKPSTARIASEESKPKAAAQKQRLTEEEKEKRLKDMMDNAAWRDKERTRYVQNYREGYQKEEEQNKARDFDKEFINTQLRKAISTQNSVESRIRSNVNNIQRTSAAMNANFAKK